MGKDFYQAYYFSQKEIEADSLGLADNLSRLGVLCFTQKREIEAETLLREAIHIYQRKDPQYINLFARYAYLYLGIIYKNQNRINEAETLFIQTAQMDMRTTAICNLELARVYKELGDIFKKQNRLNEAQVILLKAVSILKTIHTDYIYDVDYDLAIVCSRQENG